MSVVLLGRLNGLAVGLNTGAGDDGVGEELVEFFVFLETEENVTGDDAVLLVLADDHDGDLQNFGDEVLKDGSEVDGSADSDTFGVATVLEESGDSSDWEAQTSLS